MKGALRTNWPDFSSKGQVLTHRGDPFWPPIAVAVIASLSAGLVGGVLQHPLDLLRLFDAGVCAQILSHTFSPGGQPLPLCSRDTGIYLGALLTLSWLAAHRNGRYSGTPSRATILTCLALIAVMGIDGFNSLFTDLGLPHLYAPSNVLRLVTGVGAGSALVALLAPVFAHTFSGAVPQRSQGAPASRRLLFLAFLGIAVALVLLQSPWLALPIAVLSSAGVFLIVALLNTIFLHGVRGLLSQNIATLQNPNPILIQLIAITELGLLGMLHLALQLA